MTQSMHIIGSPLLGGAENFYLRLISGLTAADQPVIAVNRQQSLVARELGELVPQYHVSMSNQWCVVSRWKISHAIKRYRPDIVQTYMTRATVMTNVPPSTGTVHIARLGGYYNIKRFHHAHAWIGNTKGICDYLVQGGLPAERVFYISNFVEPATFVTSQDLLGIRAEYAVPDDAIIVMAAGRLTHKKGMDLLLDAFARLPKDIDGKPLYLLIAGDGPLRDELKKQAHSLGLNDRLHWLGWQTMLGPYYNLADMLICPSRHEPLGNVILEGWSYGKTVIATETLGASELIRHGENGWLVPSENPAEMAKAMLQLLQDTLLSQALAAAGQQTVNTQFDQKQIINAYIELYQQLLGC